MSHSSINDVICHSLPSHLYGRALLNAASKALSRLGVTFMVACIVHCNMAKA